MKLRGIGFQPVRPKGEFKFSLACGLFILLLVPCISFAQDQKKTSVGVYGRLTQLILPGTELEVLPPDRNAPVVVRIAEAFRHGTACRYDLIYYGLEPGEFDLAKYLRRKDGSSMADVPPIRVIVEPVLPPGQILPNSPEHRAGPALGGYRLLLIVLGVAWALGLAFILFWGRRRKHEAGRGIQRELTFADRLRPLVEKAAAGSLQREERAELERMLLGYWQRRLDLERVKPDQAFTVLRDHPDAGPLLRQLETWLHQPRPEHDVDISAMLEPYQNLPVEVRS